MIWKISFFQGSRQATVVVMQAEAMIAPVVQGIELETVELLLPGTEDRSWVQIDHLAQQLKLDACSLMEGYRALLYLPDSTNVLCAHMNGDNSYVLGAIEIGTNGVTNEWGQRYISFGDAMRIIAAKLAGVTKLVYDPAAEFPITLMNEKNRIVSMPEVILRE